MAACLRKHCVGHFRCCFQKKFGSLCLVSRSNSKLAQEHESTELETNGGASPPSQNATMCLEPWVSEGLANNTIKHKQHPGRMSLKTITAPPRLVEAASVLLEKYPVKEMSRKADKFANYLWSRHPPTTEALVNKMFHQTYHEVMEKQEREGNTEPVTRDGVLQKLRQKVYHWQPVTFDAYKSLLYLTSHLSLNYSVLLQCFSELSTRIPSFSPRSIFNLGSGLGSAVWAADAIWGSQVFEYYCVDNSQDMNTVARLLMQDGDSQKQMNIPGVVFRQFSPSPLTNQFDMVVSAYTLLEHPGKKERLETIEDLWRMTTDVLVLVENGTVAGFTLINEARDHLLKCPHDRPCPKFSKDNLPCFSQVTYKPLPQNHTKPNNCSVRYSYIILRKGRRKEGDEQWPRVIQGVVTAKNHTHCHLCCSDGNVRHTIVTARRHGKDLYKCTRYTQWGDLLPVTLSHNQQ
ncbi:hypothetical protein BaRGS_00027048 [Batillaria attramentaria]|uniref:Methyltransferase-like protein 17, mitochondrial n=1 Tax=Batillaria attramentaria TaxID=370345 RepID=A0ABD0K446_9CAEN